MIITNSRYALVGYFITSYPTRAHGIIVNYKQLLDEGFVISGIIKVEASVIGRGQTPRLITLAETLIIPNITKTEFSYCFIIHCFIENIRKLLREMCVDFICARLKILGQTHQAATSLKTTQVRAFFSQRHITRALRAV